MKIINMEFLLEHALSDRLKEQTFYLAAHFSNLVKVSERVTVRHEAGRGLIRIASSLPIEQINELVIELTKGLEIGEYQFSKYIPEYLGELVLYLHPRRAGRVHSRRCTRADREHERQDRIRRTGHCWGGAAKISIDTGTGTGEPDETHHASQKDEAAGDAPQGTGELP